MAYTLSTSLILGSGLTGITSDLRAMLVDSAGVDVGSAVSTGFVEQGGGTYLWTYAAFPDGHRGGVRFYRFSTSAVLAFVAINPQEVENTDVKTSTRNATAPLDSTATATATQTGMTAQGYTTTRAGYLDTLNGLVAAIWDRLTSAITTAGSIGKLIKDNLDAAVSSRNATTPPTVGAIADQVWDEAISGHTTAGTTGALLNAAGAASDPLLNTVPGSYASGTAGAALGRIGSGQITTTSPVAPDGDVTIWAGYDMLAADGYSLDWTDTSNVWPVLTGATISMICRGPSNMTFTGSVITATGTSKKVRVELQDTATVDMPISNHWVYDVSATLSGSGDVIPLVKGGRLYVKAKPG